MQKIILRILLALTPSMVKEYFEIKIAALKSQIDLLKAGMRAEDEELIFNDFSLLDSPYEFRKAVSHTIYKYPGGINDLSEKIGISANYLYRTAMQNQNGYDMGLANVVKLMQITGDFTILDYINHKFGFYKVNPPTQYLNKMDGIQAIDDLQTNHLMAMIHLKDFFNEPTHQKSKSAEMNLYKSLSAIQNARMLILLMHNQNIQNK